jgi:hypothetical protein
MVSTDKTIVDAYDNVMSNAQLQSVVKEANDVVYTIKLNFVVKEKKGQLHNVKLNPIRNSNFSCYFRHLRQSEYLI